MAEASLGKRVVGWIVVIVLSPILVPIMILQAAGLIKTPEFKWETFPEDRDVPLRRWARCAQSVVANNTDNDDNEQAAIEGLEKGWRVKDGERYKALVEAMHQLDEKDKAWDLTRLIAVSRMAMAAGYCDDEMGWEDIRKSADELRSRYHSWDELAQAMKEGLERQAESDPQPWNEPAKQLMQRNVEKLKESLWADTPWDIEFD